MGATTETYPLPSGVVDTISSAFGLEGARVLGEPEHGTRYLAYRLLSYKGDFALLRPRQNSANRIREKGISHALKKTHRIERHLARYGFPAPVPLRTREGSTIMSVRGIPYVLYPYVNGHPMQRDNAHQIATAASTLGSYHAIMAKYPQQRLRSEYFFPDQFQEWLRPFYENVKTLGALSSKLGISRELKYFEERLEDIKGGLFRLPYDRLPKLTIHGDYRGANLLFQGEKLSAVIDFHRCRFDARSMDIAIAFSDIVAKANDGKALSLARNFVTAYESVQPLDKVEKRALPVLTEARIAWRALRKVRKVVKTQDRSKQLRRARKFRRYVRRMRWLRNNWTGWENVFRGAGES